ncbi:hypothetical protein GQ43DRAFT_243863 [Delitschia confertaspora ATCC 74209]|uniref:Secreted protein n=1 Tax=Delitschia confertaspora ATCC 74209 TaxID=1513339 RepID=A0A9P4JCB3_9PLEO|nr:hypothetical protein GQ43DRAFT_243863 [Delitschia confertaspora ATCC 74209]
MIFYLFIVSIWMSVYTAASLCAPLVTLNEHHETHHAPSIIDIAKRYVVSPQPSAAAGQGNNPIPPSESLRKLKKTSRLTCRQRFR